MHIVTVKNEYYGRYAGKINMSYFCLNLDQTAEDSDMFTVIWQSSRGLTQDFQKAQFSPNINMYW